MKLLLLNLFAVALLLASCSNSSTTAQAQSQKKVSQFDRAGYCDFLIDKSGIYHAVFQEAPAIGKPTFIYYSSSADKGANWSKPITLSNDNTGNGAGYARILQDGSGKIYAIWKQYGGGKSPYPVQDVTLDGIGGYTVGTLYYKVLSGGAWSDRVMLNEMEGTQNTWFATVAPTGGLYVFWAQGDPEQVKLQHVYWYYCDYLRCASLNGTTHSAFTDLSKPTQPTYAGGYPAKQAGGINLNGYVDKAGKPHFIYEDIDSPNNIQTIKYYDGTTQRVVYSYPAYQAKNTFNNPAHLLTDENGMDHVVFLPAPSTLESEQVWDMNLATNKTTVLTSIQKEGVSILGFQASQGPNGQMAVTFEAGALSDNHEAYGLFYKNGTWNSVGLTNNAAKEKFFSRDVRTSDGFLGYVAVLTNYRSRFASVAYDAAGRKQMLMTIAGHTVGTGYSTDDPFITFSSIDR